MYTIIIYNCQHVSVHKIISGSKVGRWLGLRSTRMTGHGCVQNWIPLRVVRLSCSESEYCSSPSQRPTLEPEKKKLSMRNELCGEDALKSQLNWPRKLVNKVGAVASTSKRSSTVGGSTVLGCRRSSISLCIIAKIGGTVFKRPWSGLQLYF